MNTIEAAYDGNPQMEWDRLTRHWVEYELTMRALAEHLPPPPARVAAEAARREALGGWAGVEEGQPLAWHFDRLREAGFAGVDCFWRCDGDAIYGGTTP